MQMRSHGTCQPYPWPRDNYNVLDGHLKSFGLSMRASFLSRIRLPCQETVNLLGESSARSGAGGFAPCAGVFKVGLVEPLVSGGVVRGVAINERVDEEITGVAGGNKP